MGQGEGTIWTLRDIEQEFMLTFWRAGKGLQSTIGPEMLNERWWAKVAQQERSLRCLKDLAPRGGCAAFEVQEIKNVFHRRLAQRRGKSVA